MPKRNGYHHAPHDRRYASAVARNLSRFGAFRSTYFNEEGVACDLATAKHRLGVRASDSSHDRAITTLLGG
jgi:hypothetical protein